MSVKNANEATLTVSLYKHVSSYGLFKTEFRYCSPSEDDIGIRNIVYINNTLRGVGCAPARKLLLRIIDKIRKTEELPVKVTFKLQGGKHFYTPATCNIIWPNVDIVTVEACTSNKNPLGGLSYA